MVKIDHINFREEITQDIGNKTNNREVLEQRLNNRKVLNSGNLNPFIDQSKYIKKIDNQDNYLRPKNTNIANNYFF